MFYFNISKCVEDAASVQKPLHLLRKTPFDQWASGQSQTQKYPDGLLLGSSIGYVTHLYVDRWTENFPKSITTCGKL